VRRGFSTKKRVKKQRGGHSGHGETRLHHKKRAKEIGHRCRKGWVGGLVTYPGGWAPPKLEGQTCFCFDYLGRKKGWQKGRGPQRFRDEPRLGVFGIGKGGEGWGVELGGGGGSGAMDLMRESGAASREERLLREESMVTKRGKWVSGTAGGGTGRGLLFGVCGGRSSDLGKTPPAHCCHHKIRKRGSEACG